MNTNIFRAALTLALLAACTGASSLPPVSGIEEPQPQAPLSITGVPATDQPYGTQFTVSSSGGSGSGAVSFAASGACSNTAGGAQVTISSGSGTCSVTATKAADANYRSATSPAATVAASRAAQDPLRVVDMPEAAQPTGSRFRVTSAGGSGTGALHFTASGACSVEPSSGEVEITASSGTCSVAASKAADSNYDSATSPAATVSATAASPPAKGGLPGMYMGFRVNFDGQPYVDLYTFLADGRAFRSTPGEGLARPVDWPAACRSECGTYTVSGDEIVFRRESASEQIFLLDAEGVLRKPGQTQGYRRMNELNDVRLDASYGSVSAEGDTIAAITLRADGRFRERGILAWTSASSVTGGAPPARGEGSYSISRSTLELRYDSGVTAYLLIVLPPAIPPGPAPETVYLRHTRMGQLR